MDVAEQMRHQRDGRTDATYDAARQRRMAEIKSLALHGRRPKREMGGAVGRALR